MPWVNTKSGQVIPEPPFTAKTGITVRAEQVQMSLKVLILWKLLQGILLVLWLIVKYWWVTAPIGVVVYAWIWHGWMAGVGLVLGAAAVLGMWILGHQASFWSWFGYPYKAKIRRFVLSRRWAKTMVGVGLSTSFRGDQLIPVLRKVRCRQWQDLVTVRMVDGQIPQDFSEVAQRFAHAFRVRMVKVGFGKRPDEVVLHLMHGDPLARVVGPLAVTAMPDFEALPMGMQENGDPFTLRLFGNQVLGVGATGAGKASIAWSFIRALAGGVTSGVARLWVFDPKGGMELAAGMPMFDKFMCDDAKEMADTLDLAVGELRGRAARLRGKTRQHIPTCGEPLTVVVIDELASLTAYADKPIRERIRQSLGVILTQGRAVGFHVLALVQDPRKEVVPFRDLFTVRIGLRMNEAEQVDMVLGDGARDRGAVCDRISERTPGVAYVVLDNHPAPVRVRMSYLDDDHIAAMAATYSKAGVIDGHLVPTQRTETVIDLPTTGWMVNR